MKHVLSAIVVASVLTTSLEAQQMTHSAPATAEAMKKLEFLVGEWEGDA